MIWLDVASYVLLAALVAWLWLTRARISALLDSLIQYHDAKQAHKEGYELGYRDGYGDGLADARDAMRRDEQQR